MASRNESRVCRLHELVIRDAQGYSRAFRFGEIVEMTPWLTEALGDYLVHFDPITVPSPLETHEAEPATPVEE